jgi:hypothetical protein
VTAGAKVIAMTTLDAREDRLQQVRTACLAISPTVLLDANGCAVLPCCNG